MRDRYRGCLLGGVVGDALGAGIEFSSLVEIRREYGPAGVTGYVPCYGRSCAITDDTQMTLFTAEGLLRARGSAGDVPGALWGAYQRWLLTQHAGGPVQEGRAADGWLVRQEFLHHGRSPGATCLSALAAGRPGTADAPVNDSKGCGGVMRVAPAGLAGLSGGDPFTLGGQAAALTHGHPSGYLAAAAFAQMISDLVHGRNVADAADAAIGRLQAQGEAEVSAALAVAVYCALSAADFRSGVLLAVNHGGDSDSTGAICGNLLGARLGAGAIDSGLLDGLEGRKVITQVADDLYDVFACGREPSSQRYPA